MAEETTMAMMGSTNATCSERRSATHPIMVGDGTSPRMGITKIFTANAVARMCPPTELMTAAFRGDVLNNKKKTPPANIRTNTWAFFLKKKKKHQTHTKKK